LRRFILMLALLLTGTIVFSQGKFSDEDCSPDLSGFASPCSVPPSPPAAKAQILYNIIGAMYDRKIMATVDGVSYVAFVPEMGTSSIVAQVDINNDGYTDLVHSWTGGGNCCAPSYAVLLYLGSGVFKNISHDDFWAWGDPEIIRHGSGYRIRVDSTVAGIGRTEMTSTMTVFEVVDGDLVVVDSVMATAMVPTLAELKATDFETYGYSKSSRLQIEFDVDADNRLDVLSCGWWERWGVLSCRIELATGKVVEINQGCTRVGFLATRNDGMNDIICGRDQRARYSSAQGVYVFQ